MNTNSAICEKPGTTAPAAGKQNKPIYEPSADVIEKKDAIHILLDLPGVDQRGLDVTIEEHTLHIRGKSAFTEHKPQLIALREFEHADYERTFRLTPDVDESRITANLKNGLLRIVLPKSEAAKPRQISVKTE